MADGMCYFTLKPRSPKFCMVVYLKPNVLHRCRHYGTGVNCVAPVPSYSLDKINGTGA